MPRKVPSASGYRPSAGGDTQMLVLVYVKASDAGPSGRQHGAIHDGLKAPGTRGARRGSRGCAGERSSGILASRLVGGRGCGRWMIAAEGVDGDTAEQQEAKEGADSPLVLRPIAKVEAITLKIGAVSELSRVRHVTALLCC